MSIFRGCHIGVPLKQITKIVAESETTFKAYFGNGKLGFVSMVHAFLILTLFKYSIKDMP